MKLSSKIFTIIVLFSLINVRVSDSVCDLELLLLELKQDLEDNNILDCLREIKPPNGVIETPEQINKRLAAQWDSSCSFESTSDWFSKLKNNFDVTTLVDEIGEPVEQNIPDQADMCEIVRALIAAGKFEGISTDLTNVQMSLLTAIDCPGEEKGTKICAVNGISIYKKDMWSIFLESSVITIDGKPLFTKSAETKGRFAGNDLQPDDPGLPVNRADIDALKRVSTDVNNQLQDEISREKDFTKTDRTRPSEVDKRVSLWQTVFKDENILSNQGWKDFTSGRIDVNANFESFIILYHMVSGYSPNTRIATRLLFDEVNTISTRMLSGFSHNPSITSAFVTKSQIGKHVIKTQYRSNTELKIDPTNKETDNLITGAILIPYIDLKILKIINPDEIQLFNSNAPAEFPNLGASFKLNKTSLVLIMYSISMPGMESHIVTNLDVNSTSVFQSRSICGNATYWNIHNASVVKLMADVEYRIKVKYRTPYPARTNPRMNDWESQSLTVLQLPDWFNLQVVDIEEEFTLNCENTWVLFPKMDIDLELEDNKAILFLYNVALPLVDKTMTVGIFLNDILDVSLLFFIYIFPLKQKRSIITLSKQMYFKASGYYPINLDKGKYKIHFKYKSEACVTYKPRTDWQNISLSILDMN